MIICIMVTFLSATPQSMMLGVHHTMAGGRVMEMLMSPGAGAGTGCVLLSKGLSEGPLASASAILGTLPGRRAGRSAFSISPCHAHAGCQQPYQARDDCVQTAVPQHSIRHVKALLLMEMQLHRTPSHASRHPRYVQG